MEIISEKFISKRRCIRYRIINMSTGQVLCDCDGYGYKTRQRAYKAYYYIAKNIKPEMDKKIDSRAKASTWLLEHEEFWDYLDFLRFEIAIGKREDEFNAKFIEKIMIEKNLRVDFSSDDLYYVYLNCNH